MNRKTSPDGLRLYREVGMRLAQEREERHITQQVVADACGVTPATVSNWEKGLHGMTMENLASIGRLGISLDWLVLNNGRPHFAPLRSP